MPESKSDEKKAIISVQVPQSMYDGMAELAADNDRYLSQEVRRAFAGHIERQKKINDLSKNN